MHEYDKLNRFHRVPFQLAVSVFQTTDQSNKSIVLKGKVKMTNRSIILQYVNKLKQIPDFENTKSEDKNTVYSFSNTKLLLVQTSLIN